MMTGHGGEVCDVVVDGVVVCIHFASGAMSNRDIQDTVLVDVML